MLLNHRKAYNLIRFLLFFRPKDHCYGKMELLIQNELDILNEQTNKPLPNKPFGRIRLSNEATDNRFLKLEPLGYRPAMHS